MAYEPRLLCHMNRFIGGGGGLQIVDRVRLENRHIPIVDEKDTVLIRKHFLRVANMQILHLLIPKNLMHVSLTWAGTCS